MVPRFATLGRIPKGVWVLGGVSLLMDVSSEMIHSLLPLFMATTLGASVIIIGLIEGLAEATALILKVFSGAISDYVGKRKGLALLGYGLGALSKPLFAIAPTAGVVFSARMIDRVGKGIRGAPRDALVADVTPPEIRGAAYGLRQALDTVGAFLGPLLAVLLMFIWANDFHAIFWVAVIPAVLSILLLGFGLQEPKSAIAHKRSNPLKRENLKKLSAAYWWVVAIGSIFTLARFSEAFLVLRAQQMEIPLYTIPLVMVAMNLVYSLTAYPFGKLSDSMSHSKLLQWGLLVLILADIVLALSGHWSTLLIGVALWGIHMGMTQGLLAAMVAHTAPPELRGTAFGMFNLMSGLALLLASTGAGVLWETLGAASTFYAGAIICVVTLIGMRVMPSAYRQYKTRLRGQTSCFTVRGESPGARYLLLPIVGVWPMLTLKMLIHQPAIDGLQLRINAAGNPRHARHLFHHHRVVYRLVGVFAPGKWPVLIDDDPRGMQRIGLTQRFDNHLPGVQLVGLVHLLCAKRPGAGNIAEEVVRMGGAERRDRQPRLRPGGGVRRMGMHHPAKVGITAIERQMGGGIRGGTPAPFHHVPLQINHRHVIDGH